MRLTQGTFSYLPDLTDEEILAQASYAIAQDWALAVELTDDPHPRNVYWEMWGLPLFDVTAPERLLAEVHRARDAFGDHYIRVTSYDARLGRQTTALSFIVNRPTEEPGFRLERHEAPGRRLVYSLSAYAAERPSGARYGKAAASEDGRP
jgi:ribulose-bisphosphate carboxylase small chain